MSDSGLNKFFCLLHYGATFDSIPTTPDDMRRFALALLKIVGADGLSEKEQWAYAEIGRHVGAPEALIQQLLATDPSKLDLAELLAGFTDGVNARAMLFDAITVASADGYSDEERKVAAEAAKTLGIDEPTLRAIEALVETEAAFRRTKGAILGFISKK